MAKAKGGRRRSRNSGGNGMTGRIIETLTTAPGTKTSELADMLGSDQLTVRNELMKLEKAGAVSRTGQTRGTRWYVADADAAAKASEAELPPEAGESKDGRRGPQEKKLDGVKADLGKIPDSDIAAKTGVSVRTIAAYRKRHGIVGYSGPRRRGGEAAPKATPAAKAPRASGGSSNKTAAWKVDIRVGRDVNSKFVLARNLADAVSLASSGASKLGGDVIGLSWVGDSLDG